MSFTLEDGVAIPPREAVGRGKPRETQYPLDQWKVGQSFKLVIEGREGQTRTKKDGTTIALSVDEDAERQARQKASAIASLAKRRGQSIVTRWNHSTEPGVLRVWHNGPYVAKTKSAADEQPAPDAPQAGAADDFDL